MTPELELVPVRAFLSPRPRVRFELQPGDHPIVGVGETIRAGDVLAERIRDPRLVEVRMPRRAVDQVVPLPGTWLPGEHARPGRRAGAPAGELLFEHAGRRRLVTGVHVDRLHAPADGHVVDVESGVAIVIDFDGPGLVAGELLGEASAGRLVLLPDESDPRLAMDIALAGSVVVVPGRVDAEALTRARAMGIHGAIVESLTERDRRDLAASAARQQAGLHRMAPFGVLVLGGYLRRALPAAIRAVLEAIAGDAVGLVGDPPLLLLPPRRVLPLPEPDHLSVRGGPEAGREGRWLGPGGLRQLRGGVVAETGLVALDDGRTVAVPIGELERFAAAAPTG